VVPDVGWALHQVDVEPGGHVPGDVAVEGPDAGVVGIVLEHVVAVAADDVRVAARRVGRVGDRAVPLTGARGELIHVMACGWC